MIFMMICILSLNIRRLNRWLLKHNILSATLSYVDNFFFNYVWWKTWISILCFLFNLHFLIFSTLVFIKFALNHIYIFAFWRNQFIIFWFCYINFISLISLIDSDSFKILLINLLIILNSYIFNHDFNIWIRSDYFLLIIIIIINCVTFY